MFARTLLDDEDFRLSLSLLGALRAENKRTGRTVRASEDEKRLLFGVVDFLQSKGENIHPSNEKFQKLFVDFAEALLSKPGLRWRAFMMGSAEEHAKYYL